MDMGSGEMKFFRYLLDVPGIQEIILLDKDDQTMQVNNVTVTGLNSFTKVFFILVI